MPASERLSLVSRVDMVKHRLLARSRRKEQSRPWHKTAAERVTRFRDPIQLPFDVAGVPL